jgi:hypothetical protein
MQFLLILQYQHHFITKLPPDLRMKAKQNKKTAAVDNQNGMETEIRLEQNGMETEQNGLKLKKTKFFLVKLSFMHF